MKRLIYDLPCSSLTPEPRLAVRFPSSPWYELCCWTTDPYSQRSVESIPSARTASVHFRDILPFTPNFHELRHSSYLRWHLQHQPSLSAPGNKRFWGLFGALWRSLTSSTSASCNRLRISANSLYASRSPVTRSTRDDSSGPNAATVQAQYGAVITLTVTNVSTRPYVHTCSAAMKECAVVFLLVVVVTRHPQPSHRVGHPCTVDVLPGPTDVTYSPG